MNQEKQMAAKKSNERVSWVGDNDTPQIEERARNLESFLGAMADGKVETHEVDAQEERLVALMREVEPLLDDAQHAKVTELLCELTAYDLMQILNMLHEARPKHVFQG